MKKAILTSLFLAIPGMALADLTIADLQPDTQVTISGIVDRLADEDTFILRDDSGEIEVYLGPNPVPVAVASHVTVSGVVDGDATAEIYATSLTTDSGEDFHFSHAYN